jgi:predicted PurR-regulated permease PerM
MESAKTVRGNIVFAFGIAAFLGLLWFARDVVMLIYASALFAVVFTPVVRGVQRIRIRGWHPGHALSIVILIGTAVVLIVAFLVFALPPVMRDLQAFAREAPQRVPGIAEKIHRLPFLRDQTDLDLRGKLQNIFSTSASWLFSSLPDAASLLSRFFMGVILTIYFMLEGPEAYQWVLSFVPIGRRVRLDAALQRAEVRMGKWLLAQGSLMLILGVCSFIVFAALHLRYYYVLAILMGMFNIIPVAGAVISIAIAMLVAAVDSWSKVIGVAIFFAIYQQIENGYLTPRIMKSSVDLAGLAVIVALLVGGKIAGILGAVIAVPSAVLVAVLLDEYLVQHDRYGREPEAGPEPAA